MIWKWYKPWSILRISFLALVFTPSLSCFPDWVTPPFNPTMTSDFVYHPRFVYMRLPPIYGLNSLLWYFASSLLGFSSVFAPFAVKPLLKAGTSRFCFNNSSADWNCWRRWQRNFSAESCWLNCNSSALHAHALKGWEFEAISANRESTFLAYWWIENVSICTLYGPAIVRPYSYIWMLANFRHNIFSNQNESFEDLFVGIILPNCSRRPAGKQQWGFDLGIKRTVIQHLLLQWRCSTSITVATAHGCDHYL